MYHFVATGHNFRPTTYGGMKLLDYLAAAGASDITEIRPFLYQYKLPGDHHAAGRATTTRDGQARLWHRGSRDGLALSSAWVPAAPVEHKTQAGQAASVPSYTARIADLKPGDKIEKIAIDQRPLLVASDDELRAAALVTLQAAGWTAVGQQRELVYLNDGAGSTPACRLAVRQGVAAVWSFRGDVDLPAPWRPGRPLPTGEKTMFATARDLGVAASQERSAAPLLPPVTPAQQPVDRELAQQVVDYYRNGRRAPADHRHLTKKGAELWGGDMRVIPPGTQHAGDLVVPLFRPAGSGTAVEVSGAQRLCSAVTMGTDKMLMSGSRLAGSFAPLPLSPLIARVADGKADLKTWADGIGPGAKSKPLIVCEGVATALALLQSGAGYPVAAISSGNTPAVAKYLRESGIADIFSDLVIATDYDIGIKDGKAKSQAIQKAIAAGHDVGAKIAIPPSGSLAGTDARDLFAGGAQVVRDYISSAVDPSDAAQRQDIKKFLELTEKSRGIER